MDPASTKTKGVSKLPEPEVEGTEMTPNADEVTKAFVATREEIRRLEKELEEKIKPMKELQERRELYLLKLLSDAGAQNMKTQHGTIYQTKKESVTCADWDAFIEWVKENDKYEFLDHRINKTASLEYMNNGENPPPPGASYTAIRSLGVRKN